MIEATSQVFDKGIEHLRRGRAAEAERLLRELLRNAHVIDREYDAWVTTAIEAWRALGRRREAAWGLLYLHRFAEAKALFLPTPDTRAGASRDPTIDGARCDELAARAAPTPAEAKPHYAAAAAAYLAAGRSVRAAICCGLAGDPEGARKAWLKVLVEPRLRARPYELALGHFNVGLASRRAGDATAGNHHLVEAQRLLEEVADDFEARGERERAFDCYVILLQLGKDSGAFENLAEGYINCIRVLKEDNLKFYALQYYEDFLRMALDREEFHAAATVVREAADYARRVGMIYDRGYLKRAAETWWKAAEKNERDGGAGELTENAYLAAVDCWNSLGDFYKVRETYQKLAALGLPEKKKQRYAIVASRYASVSPQHIDTAAFPDYLRQQHAYPPVWEDDLIEWEVDGDPQAVCGSIVGDVRYPDQTRRRALNVLLLASGGYGRAGAEEAVTLAQIAEGLGGLQAYQALSPLERLSTHADPQVRRAVLRACRHLSFKRTFLLIRRGLVDEAKDVRDAALEAVAQLHMTHAFDPLTRLFREHEDPAVKSTALRSLGAIASLEAGEFLIEVLRYEVEPYRDQARQLLVKFNNSDIFPILRKHLELESGPARPLLEQILRSAPPRTS